MSVTEKNARKRYDNSDLQEVYNFMKRKSGERTLGLYVLKGTRTALRGKEGVILPLYPDDDRR